MLVLLDSLGCDPVATFQVVDNFLGNLFGGHCERERESVCVYGCVITRRKEEEEEEDDDDDDDDEEEEEEEEGLNR